MTITDARDRLSGLVLASESIARARTLEELLDALQQAAGQVTDASVFLVGLYDEASGTIDVVRQVDRGRVLPRGSFPLGTGFTSRAIITRTTQRVRSFEKAQGIQVLYRVEEGELQPPRSALTAPLMTGGRILGVLSVQSYREDAYGDADEAAVRVLAATAAAVLDGLGRTAGLASDERRRLSELEAVLASMADALLVVDATGAIVGMNAAARDLLAAGGGGIVLGRPLEDQATEQWPLAARDVAEALREMIGRILAGAHLDDVEVRLGRGEVRVLSFSGAPVRMPEGREGGAVLVFRDVTSAREVADLKDELLSTASHDLKTPLAAMRARLQLLARRLEGTPPQEARAQLDMAMAQMDRLAGLIDALTDVSRIRAGRLEIARDEVDLVRIANEVAEGLGGSSEGHRIVVEAPGALVGHWDGTRLGQVLQNLISNALKYSASGEIRLRVGAEGTSAVVSVADQGVGLAPDQLEKVFDRAYRAPGSENVSGQGLGLYISQAIVAAHGGRIWATSAGPGQGSTFSFTVPLQAEE